MTTSASRIARSGTGLAEVDLGTELVNTMLAEHDFKAAATIVKVADRMARSTIDILA